MHPITAACHCGNIRTEVELSAPPLALHPRACDCDFCRKHGAAYISDPKGSLSIRIERPDDSVRYRQGSGLAECLVCRSCGVLVAVLHRDGKRVFGAINARAATHTRFAADEVVSPKLLSGEDKVDRWKRIWFADVELHGDVSEKIH